MTTNALYTDLASLYDLLCANIDYATQSHMICRLHRLFGNGGRKHLDLACGTGPHIRSFMDFGYQCQGLDIHQPMLDHAQQRCPDAVFTQGDMAAFSFHNSFDLITCFLYSIHYNANIAKLLACITCVHRALNSQGVFCFNAVDKAKIDNSAFDRHCVNQEGSEFRFQSAWHYEGAGEQQSLKLRIERETQGVSQIWQDEHAMVAVDFAELRAMLEPLFDVHVLAHDYDKLVPWDQLSGNALFVCVKP